MPEDHSVQFALIVEDHPLVLDSLVACVRDCDPGLEVNTAESLSAAIRVLAHRPVPLLIVTDLTLTDARGIEAVRQLRQAAPQACILVFTALDDQQLRSAAKALGVIDYLIKSASTQTLRDAIRAVIGSHPDKDKTAPVAPGRLNHLLTPKQLAVLEELISGRSNKQIAVRMNVSEMTVGSHVKEIFGRLGVRNRTEAVSRYFQIANQTSALPGREVTK